MNNNPVYAALDTTDLDYARELAGRLRGSVGGLKLDPALAEGEWRWLTPEDLAALTSKD